MTFDQVFLFSLLVAVFALLISGRIRYDIVAFGALFLGVVVGVVPKDQVFSGFGHPATVIVALVLIVSRGLSNSGAVGLLARRIVDTSRGIAAHVGLLSAVAATLSALMNNVATLALLMPVDMRAAAKAKRSPALTLMPLSFATILGGMITLIGTPPNIVIATFRDRALGEPFQMFDFAPVGIVVAVVGVVYVALVGWRLIPAEPRRKNTSLELEDLTGYISEAVAREGSKALDKRLHELLSQAESDEVSLLGIVRDGTRLPGTARNETICEGDVLVLEGSPEAIDGFVGAVGLEYTKSEKQPGLLAEALALAEVVVPLGARIEGRSAMEVGLLRRQGITLLGVSRRGQRFRDRVRRLRIQPGDILLLLGPEDRLPDVIHWLGCLPLAERGLQVVQRHKAGLAIGVFAAAIAASSLGWIGLPAALGGVVVAYVGFRIVPVSQIYDAVEWPVVVLLGSLIPIGAALEASGGTSLVARGIVGWTAGLSPAVVLAILMIVTMTLSDVLNNVATALVAAPIGVEIATRLGVNPDPFLMGVAVASSCAFLTPIGHKNNTIIMGPGGYRFGDYWRIGLPLEILVVLIGVPLIRVVWPF